jgi:hypothetical protein
VNQPASWSTWPGSNDRLCDIGYSLLPSFHGSRYAAEALCELIRWAFSHLDVDPVTSETLPTRLSLPRSIDRIGQSMTDCVAFN